MQDSQPGPQVAREPAAHPSAHATMLIVAANQMGFFLTQVKALDGLLLMRGSWHKWLVVDECRGEQGLLKAWGPASSSDEQPRSPASRPIADHSPTGRSGSRRRGHAATYSSR